MTPDEAAQTLRDWSSSNPNAPQLWHLVCLRLANHYDMPQAWKELLKLSDAPIAVAVLVRRTLEAAIKETSRQSPSDEKNSLNKVLSLVRQLRTAIEKSPLPDNSAHPIGPGGNILLGWKGGVEHLLKWHPGNFAFTVVDVLDFVEEETNRHINELPIRAVSRDKGRALEVAFVRWLSYFLNLEFGKRAMYATIGRIVSAVLNLDDSLDRASVETILKDSPKRLKPTPLNSA
jgi:hypothetical protein